MRINLNETAWWGAPKKFDREAEERRVSWLELFYDLVYVIAISRITHHFAQHMSVHSFIEFCGLFILIFWGWLNGSLYHDLHGNEGLRTRLMTLWQMLIIAALAITVEQTAGHGYTGLIIVLMIMQLFITYLWWSVGLYDKAHRRYNMPYTYFFLTGMALMFTGIFVNETWLILLLPAVIFCNYLPPFIASRMLQRSSMDLHLSASMYERLGLFTIIVFGELVLGVVNGIGSTSLTLQMWINFALALSIVFSLWWIFFTLLSNREVKKGFTTATLLELLFIPSLISLGLMAASLSSIFENAHSEEPLQQVFNLAVAIFLTGINLIMGFLEYPEFIHPLKTPVRRSLLICAALFLILACLPLQLNSFYYLSVVLVLLLIEITFLNAVYYRLVAKRGV